MRLCVCLSWLYLRSRGVVLLCAPPEVEMVWFNNWKEKASIYNGQIRRFPLMKAAEYFLDWSESEAGVTGSDSGTGFDLCWF